MKAYINNQLLTVRIKDANYNDHAVEVEILEGTFKGKYTIVEKKDLVKPNVKVNGKFNKYTNDKYNVTCGKEEYYRTLDFVLEITGVDSDIIAEQIKNIIENETEFKFTNCPEIEASYYCDTMAIDFESGRMTEYKKEIQEAFKIAKQLVLGR